MNAQQGETLFKTPTSPRFNVRPLVPDDNRTIKQKFGVDVVNIAIATAGDLHYIDAAGHEDTVSLPAGLFPAWFQKIFATGTTASGITAIW